MELNLNTQSLAWKPERTLVIIISPKLVIIIDLTQRTYSILSGSFEVLQPSQHSWGHVQPVSQPIHTVPGQAS